MRWWGGIESLHLLLGGLGTCFRKKRRLSYWLGAQNIVRGLRTSFCYPHFIRLFFQFKHCRSIHLNMQHKTVSWILTHTCLISYVYILFIFIKFCNVKQSLSRSSLRGHTSTWKSTGRRLLIANFISFSSFSPSRHRVILGTNTANYIRAFQ